jgi:hypothetical protein
LFLAAPQSQTRVPALQASLVSSGQRYGLVSPHIYVPVADIDQNYAATGKYSVSCLLGYMTCSLMKVKLGFGGKSRQSSGSKSEPNKKLEQMRIKELIQGPSRTEDRLYALVARVSGYRSRGPGSISAATRFSEK